MNEDLLEKLDKAEARVAHLEIVIKAYDAAINALHRTEDWMAFINSIPEQYRYYSARLLNEAEIYDAIHQGNSV
jgi:hypothetical protein